MWMLLVALGISFAAYWYDVNYSQVAGQLGWGRDLLGFLGAVTWRFYLFFFLGTLMRKYFDQFQRLTDRWYVVAGIIFVFVASALASHCQVDTLLFTRFVLSGVCGMVMVFTFFRKFASWFTKDRLAGRALQYVGTRTLDVYLMHFFFLPEFLLLYNRQILPYDNRLLEVAVVLAEALVVLVACLIASYLLRLSPFLAKYLFGVKGK